MNELLIQFVTRLKSTNLYKGLNTLIMIVRLSGYGYKKQKATRND
ncbi:hypothetical protein [Paenibacillus sp. 8b26]